MARVICILGMHRSGTSAVAYVIKLLGAYFGKPDHLLQPNESNPEGYWENQLFRDINEEILKRFGGTWHSLPRLPVGWLEAEGMDELRTRALEVVQKEFEQANLWCWKDPRNCITLPFWQQIIPNVQYVICCRDPLNVSKSLQKRNGLPIRKSSRLWVEYTLSAFLNIGNAPRFVALYDNNFDNQSEELNNLVKFITGDETIDFATRTRIQSVFKAELWHNRHTYFDNLRDSEIDISSKALYLLLRNNVEQGQLKLAGCEREILQATYVASSETDSVEVSLAKRNKDVAELTAALQKRERILEAKEKQVTELTAALKKKNNDLAELTAALQERERIVRRIKSTFFWRVVGKHLYS